MSWTCNSRRKWKTDSTRWRLANATGNPCSASFSWHLLKRSPWQEQQRLRTAVPWPGPSRTPPPTGRANLMRSLAPPVRTHDAWVSRHQLRVTPLPLRLDRHCTVRRVESRWWFVAASLASFGGAAGTQSVAQSIEMVPTRRRRQGLPGPRSPWRADGRPHPCDSNRCHPIPIILRHRSLWTTRATVLRRVNR